MSRTRSEDKGSVLIFLLIPIALFLIAFVLYANTVIPLVTPTVYTNAFWGFLHGVFAVPTFIYSLFADNITIYQAPNSGGWYNLGYLIGVSITIGGGVSTT